MGMSFKDYINESTKYMFSDKFLITEAEFTLNGKVYPNKKDAESELRKRGLVGSKLSDMLSRGKYSGVSTPEKTWAKENISPDSSHDNDKKLKAARDREAQHRKELEDDDGSIRRPPGENTAFTWIDSRNALRKQEIQSLISRSKKDGTNASIDDISDFKDWRSGLTNSASSKKLWADVRKEMLDRFSVDISKGHDFIHVPKIRKAIDNHRLG